MTTQRRTTKADVLAEAQRLGATPDQLAAFEVNIDSGDFFEELAGSRAFPDPEDATTQEFPLAAALANVRQRIFAKHEGKRSKVLPGQQERMAEAREELKAKAERQARAIVAFWESLRTAAGDASAKKVHMKLENRPEIREKVLGVGVTKDEVPSEDTIQRAINRFGRK